MSRETRPAGLAVRRPAPSVARIGSGPTSSCSVRFSARTTG